MTLLSILSKRTLPRTVTRAVFHLTRSLVMDTQQPHRQFAPLSKGIESDLIDGKMVLKGVVFDVDGTLCTSAHAHLLLASSPSTPDKRARNIS